MRVPPALFALSPGHPSLLRVLRHSFHPLHNSLMSASSPRGFAARARAHAQQSSNGQRFGLLACVTVAVALFTISFGSPSPALAQTSQDTPTRVSGTTSGGRSLVVDSARAVLARLAAVRPHLSGSSTNARGASAQTSTLASPMLVESVAAHGVKHAALAAPLAAAPSPEPYASIRTTLLSIDFHISPIMDLTHQLGLRFPGARVIDRSLSGACGRTRTCATSESLAVLRAGDVDHSMHFSMPVRQAFFDAYRSQSAPPLVRDVDAMVCSHPTGMCELIMPFNRSTILFATTRFEQGRERHRERFGGWVTNFRALATLPGSAVLANNLYDVHYTHYFTGASPWYECGRLPQTLTRSTRPHTTHAGIMPQYVPSLCAYTGASWSWPSARGETRILVHGYRPHRDVYGGLDTFLAPARSAVQGFSLIPLRAALGDDYEYTALAAHPAVLHFPYQVSVMSFYEMYRMGIPQIAPSLTLLSRWHMESLFVSERTWDTVLYNSPASSSVLQRHADADEPFDPNDETNAEAVKWWLQWADFYTFPHVILFDSWVHLAELLSTVDLVKVSNDMRAFNEKQEAEIADSWANILRAVPPHSERVASDAALEGMDFASRMNAIYGAGKWAQY